MSDRNRRSTLDALVEDLEDGNELDDLVSGLGNEGSIEPGPTDTDQDSGGEMEASMSLTATDVIELDAGDTEDPEWLSELASAPSASDASAAAPAPPTAAPGLDGSLTDFVAVSDFEIPPVRKKSQGGLRGLVLGMAIVGAAFGFLATQTDVFSPARRRAKAETERAETARKEAKLRAALAKPGSVIVTSKVENAAVWMHLGKTPLTTFLMPTGQPADFRLELEAHTPRLLAVSGAQWARGENTYKAALQVALKPGSADGVPAYSPESAPEAGPPGQGQVHIESTPSGADVWLLVGFTPTAEVSGIEAGIGYWLRVLKSGYRSVDVLISAKDWYLSGEAGVGKVRRSLARTAELTAGP